MASVRSVTLSMQSNVFVEVARIPEWSKANLAFKWLVSGVRAQVDLEPILTRIQLSAVYTQVTLVRLVHVQGTR